MFHKQYSILLTSHQHTGAALGSETILLKHADEQTVRVSIERAVIVCVVVWYEVSK